MKKIIYLTSIFLIVFLSQSKASHITGYDMCMISTGVDSYKFRLVVYRDANSTTTSAASYFLRIYKNIDNLPAPIPSVTLNRISISPIIETCMPTNIEKITYESSTLNLAAFNSTSGYYISRGFCCRTNGINNVSNSANYGIVFTMDFPCLNPTSTTRNNSSPEFKNAPIVTMEINKTYNFDFNIVDPDGDSLVYKKTENLYPLGASGVAQEVDATKPFSKIDYASGYNLNSNIADGAPDFILNSQTGTLIYKPTKIGKYIISFKVEEWKRQSGNILPYKIGEVRREFQVFCIYKSNMPPVIIDAKSRAKFIRDTIILNGTTVYSNQFNSKKLSGDDVYIKLVPENGINNNIFNSNLFDVIWGVDGGISYSGSAINGAIISSKDSVKTNFMWIVDSSDIKKSPYKFKVISYDKYCPLPLTDTLNVELIVSGQCYKSKNVTLKGCDSLIDLLGRKHYSSVNLKDTILSVLGCDTILNQNIILKAGPIQNTINGDLKATPLSTHLYYIVAQPNVTYYWGIKNGEIVAGQGTNVIGVIWSNSGYLTCSVEDSITKCSVFSALNVDISTGINDSKNQKIKIYPNPNNNIITIEGLNKNETSTIHVFDANGKIVITKIIKEYGSIDLSELNKGVYLIKIGELTTRIVKI